jgi:hypothetical protein
VQVIGHVYLLIKDEKGKGETAGDVKIIGEIKTKEYY